MPSEYSASSRSSVRTCTQKIAWRPTHCVHDNWLHAHGMSMLHGLVRSGHVLMHMQHGTSCCDGCHVICPRRVPAGGAGTPRASDGHTRPELRTGQHAVLRRCILDAAVRSVPHAQAGTDLHPFTHSCEQPNRGFDDPRTLRRQLRSPWASFIGLLGEAALEHAPVVLILRPRRESDTMT